MVKWKQAKLHVVMLNSLHAEILKLQCILSEETNPKEEGITQEGTRIENLKFWQSLCGWSNHNVHNTAQQHKNNMNVLLTHYEEIKKVFRNDVSAKSSRL